MTDKDQEVSPNEFTEHPEGKVVGVTEQTVAAETVDLTGSQEEVTDPEAGTQDDPANDHRLSIPQDITEEDAEAQKAGLTLEAYRAQQTALTEPIKKEYPVELPIEYLLNMNTGNIFPVNEDIVRQKGLVPCTKDGKVLPDHRRPSDFR